MNKVWICAIAKMEELYIIEWIEWHKKIGIDHIIIGDNNDSDYNKPLKPIIQKYIDSGYVEYINLNDKLGYQLNFYNEVYQSKKNDFDWIGFIDIDEFIELKIYSNIHRFLNQEKFNNFDSIIFCWLNYGDSEQLYYENKPVKERFKEISINCYNKYQVGIKYFIRSLDNVLKLSSIHNPETGLFQNNFKIKICDVLGNQNFHKILNHPNDINSSYSRIIKNIKYYDIAYISHYVTKSTEEYIKYKSLRGRCDRAIKNYRIRYHIGHYFSINKYNENKMNLFNKYNQKIKEFGIYITNKYNN